MCNILFAWHIDVLRRKIDSDSVGMQSAIIFWQNPQQVRIKVAKSSTVCFLAACWVQRPSACVNITGPDSHPDEGKGHF